MIRKSLFSLFIITMVAVITSTSSVFAQSMTSVPPFKVGTFAIDDVPTVGLVVHDDKLIVDLAAANRGRYVVENFQQSPAVPDGLAVMAQAYNILEMQELADNAVRVLVANYPEHPSLDDMGNFDYDKRLLDRENSLLGKLTFGLIDPVQPPAFDSRHIYNKVAREAGSTSDDGKKQSRSIWSRLTFGLMD